jgi:hypothetical protein
VILKTTKVCEDSPLLCTANTARLTMFGTLHLASQDKEAMFIERPHGSSNLEKNSACNRCRAKKVFSLSVS